MVKIQMKEQEDERERTKEDETFRRRKRVYFIWPWDVLFFPPFGLRGRKLTISLKTLKTHDFILVGGKSVKFVILNLKDVKSLGPFLDFSL